MNSITEVFETISIRLRNPIMGSIFLTFVIVNWKPLFYLFFSETNVIDKFSFFEANTCWVRIFIAPTLIGILYAWLSPKISYWGVKLAQKPDQLKRKLHNLNNYKDKEDQIHYDSLIDKIQVKKEEKLIGQALRDEEVEQIQDINLREKLKTDIQNLRHELQDAELLKIDEKNKEHSQKLIATYRAEIKAVQEKVRVYSIELSALENALSNEIDKSERSTLKEMIKNRESYINNSDQNISNIEMQINAASQY